MKRKIISLLGIVCIAGALIVPMVSQAEENVSLQEMGEAVAEIKEEEASNTDSDIIFENDNISIQESELSAAIELSQMEQPASDAEVQALDQLIEKKNMYQIAVEEGFTVSDSDFEAYKQEFMEAYANAENKEDLEEYWEGFGGVENYWEQMKPQIMESLLIRKYLDYEMEQYADELNCDVQEAEFQEKWGVVEEQIKEDAREDAVTDAEYEQLVEQTKELAEELSE